MSDERRKETGRMILPTSHRSLGIEGVLGKSFLPLFFSSQPPPFQPNRLDPPTSVQRHHIRAQARHQPPAVL